MRETDLYAPIKAFLEAQGYEVKGEVGSADVVACRAGEDEPVIVEMKTAFSLALVHQGVARLALSDAVYIAAPRGRGRAAWSGLKNMKVLCRRLGLGLLTVRLEDGFVEAHCDPTPFSPRRAPQRKARLLREFARREGDPEPGRDAGCDRHRLSAGRGALRGASGAVAAHRAARWWRARRG